MIIREFWVVKRTVWLTKCKFNFCTFPWAGWRKFLFCLDCMASLTNSEYIARMKATSKCKLFCQKSCSCLSETAAVWARLNFVCVYMRRFRPTLSGQKLFLRMSTKALQITRFSLNSKWRLCKACKKVETWFVTHSTLLLFLCIYTTIQKLWFFMKNMTWVNVHQKRVLRNFRQFCKLKSNNRCLYTYFLRVLGKFLILTLSKTHF